MAMSGKSKSGAWYGTVLGIAVGFGLWSGGQALAAEGANGEAEAAPPAVVNERAAGRLETATPERDQVNPARIVAHTAQLPKSGSKPLFPVELPGAKNGARVPAPSAGPAPGSGASGGSPAAGPAATPDQAPARPAAGVRTPSAAAKAGSAPAARRARLPLAPSAAEIRREIADRNGGPLPSQLAAAKGAEGAAGPGTLGAAKEKPSLGSRLEERATAAPKQNPRWPTHVDYSAGPTGPAGGNTSGDRKGALIEATGPQQGVIRNRW